MWCTSPHSSRLPARSVRFVFGPFLATLSAALFVLLSSSLSLFMAAWPLPFFFHFLFCLTSPFVLYSRFYCYFFQSLFELWIFGFETLKVPLQFLQFKIHLRQYFSNNNDLLAWIPQKWGQTCHLILMLAPLFRKVCATTPSFLHW